MSNQGRRPPGDSLPLQTIPRRQARHKCGALWLAGAGRTRGLHRLNPQGVNPALRWGLLRCAPNPLRYPRQLMAAVAAAAAPTRAWRPTRCPPAALGCARAASPCAPARRLVLMSRGAPLTRRTRWRMPARGPSCTGGHALSACSCLPPVQGYARSGSGAAADAALPSPAGAPIRKVVQDFLKIPAREIEKAA